MIDKLLDYCANVGDGWRVLLLTCLSSFPAACRLKPPVQAGRARDTANYHRAGRRVGTYRGIEIADWRLVKADWPVTPITDTAGSWR
jgi:hypothetical protein